MAKAAMPARIGKYDIRSIVGKGAMGVVYSAIDPALGRAVAIKTMSVASPEQAEFRQRFLNEARSVGQLQHPNIITVHELFEEGDTAYIVMELLEGASLSSVLRRKKKLTLGEKLATLDQIAAGLSEAHRHKIVHRDLKPSNVFVLRNGVLKVLDFGVAKIGEGELTKAGTVFGTVEYMAPEQVRGQPVNARADVFSLGVVAYEVLTGKNPFRADTLAASVFKIVSDNPEAIGSQAEGISPELERVVFKALSKTESERYPSMDAFREDLRKAANADGVELVGPVLSDEDIVVSKEAANSVALSVEPQVSHWSHVAAQADMLEEVYQQGIEAFNAKDYETAVLKMSEVLDQVPVHAMALHFVAQSEENLRKSRLSDAERTNASEVLSSMRDAHRAGEAGEVIELANRLLAIDNESLEARWYRRNAEARLRAVSVRQGRSHSGSMHGTGPSQGSRGSLGNQSGRSGASFGFVPENPQTSRKSPAMVVPHMGSSASSQGGRGLYFLAGVGALFLGLVGIWLFSLKGPPPAAEASPTQLPGVRTSPFDGIDDDGTVVLQLPSPEQRPIELERAIPTSILVGEPTKVGLFGRQLPGDATVVVEGDHVELVAYEVKSETHIEVELLAKLPSPETVTLTVRNAAGFAAKVTVNITNQ